MSPELVVLGVAQDGGHPQAGCLRPCCAEARARGVRHRVACLGLVDGDRAFLVDATPDLPSQLHDLGAPPLAGLLLTHAHMGHYTGLLHLGIEAWSPSQVPVHAMPGMAAFLRANAPWTALESDGNVRLVPLAAGVPVALTERLTVEPWLVPHRGPWSETVAFRISGPSRTVLFVPDIDRWDDWERDPAEVVRGVDLAFVDGTFFDATEIPWRDPAQVRHPFVVDTLARLGHLPAEDRAKVVFVHLNHTNPLLDPASEASRRVHDLGFRVARDGERIPL